MQFTTAFHDAYRSNLDAWMAVIFACGTALAASVLQRRELACGGQRTTRSASRDMPQANVMPSLGLMGELLPSVQAHIRFDLPRAIADVFQQHYAGRGFGLETFAEDSTG